MPTPVVYSEGDWFGVPLENGRWAAGRIARLHPGAGVIFAYLFGPFPQLPTTQILEAQQPERARFIGTVSDLGIAEDGWPVIKATSWRRDDWPLVPLRNVDPIMGKTRRVEYSDGNLLRPVVWEVVDDDMSNSPEDTVYGHLSLRKRLTKLMT